MALGDALFALHAKDLDKTKYPIRMEHIVAMAKALASADSSRPTTARGSLTP